MECLIIKIIINVQSHLLIFAVQSPSKRFRPAINLIKCVRSIAVDESEWIFEKFFSCRLEPTFSF